MRRMVFILAVLAGARAAAASCAQSEEFFLRHNVSADDTEHPGAGEVCGGQCCGRGREKRLSAALQRAAERRAAATVRPIAALLLATHTTLQKHLTALSHQSQNKSAVLFAQVYRGQAARTHGPLAALYGEVRAALRPALAADGAPLVAEGPPRDLTQATRNFFRQLFPLAYHNVLRLDNKQFTTEYDVCLKDAYDTVQPFGEVPHQLGATLSRSLAGARALLQGLAAGADVLAGAEQAVARAVSGCSTRLLRAAACPRCRHLDARPCRDYCLNVARGCVGGVAAELEAPWARYVEGVEKLASTEADAALRSLDARVSQAIMHALENRVMLEKKVRQECGAPVTTEDLLARGPPLSGASRREALRAPPPDAELLQVAASLSATKRLFTSLLDPLCDEPDFAHQNNEHCWNGNTVGDYMKPLVASSLLRDQKYNLEVEGGVPQDTKVAALGDQLRQARQLLASATWSYVPAAEAFMLGDEAGEEGSGSGRSYPYDDTAFYDDVEGSGVEGSGRQDAAGTRTYTREETQESSTPRTGGGPTARPLAWLLAVVMVMLPPLDAARAVPSA